MKFGLLLIMLALASDNQENKIESTKSDERFKETNAEDLILVKIEVEEDTKANKKTSQYFGVSYCISKERWVVARWSKNEKKIVHSGAYKDEGTAAHASDTLARKLMENGAQNHKLNFPDDDTEVFPEKTKTSKYFGVYYYKSYKIWRVKRWNKTEGKPVYNGNYKDEETAAHASDTLARKLMANGEQNLKLNFPDDDTDVFPETKSSKFVGVSYNKSSRKWYVSRKNKVFNGYYKHEETAAHASDNLAIQLMENGAQNLKLNFPDDHAEYERNKRKRSEHEDMEDFQNK